MKMDRTLKSDLNRGEADFSPRGCLIRYPLLVSAAVERLVSDFQDDFKQLKDGTFKLAIKLPNKTLTELLAKYLSEERFRILSKARQGLRNYNNVWCIVSDSGSFRRAFYEFSENDVDVGMKRIEKIADALFNKWMKHGDGDRRAIWCKHKLLTSDDWERICAVKVFGKTRFEVVDKELSERRKCVVEKFKDLDSETESMLSKKETSQLIVKECADYVLEKIASFKNIC